MRSFSRALFIFLCVVPFQLHVVPYFCKAGAITDFQATGVEAVSVPLTELASVTVQQHKVCVIFGDKLQGVSKK